MSEQTFHGINPLRLQKISNDIKLTPSLKKHFNQHSIETFILNEISQINEIQKFKNDISLLLFVCNLVENVLTKTKQGETKEAIVVNVLQKIFNLNEEEIETVKQNIKFLLETKQIKKLSKLYGIGKQLLTGFLKKA